MRAINILEMVMLGCMIVTGVFCAPPELEPVMLPAFASELIIFGLYQILWRKNDIFTKVLFGCCVGSLASYWAYVFCYGLDTWLRSVRLTPAFITVIGYILAVGMWYHEHEDCICDPDHDDNEGY